jgi:hypothetical protein
MLAARLSPEVHRDSHLAPPGFTRWLSGLISIARNHRFNQQRVFGKLLSAILAMQAPWLKGNVIG